MRSISSILRTGGMLVLTVMPLCAIIDLDGDGVSDVWSSLYPNAGEPDADPDGDGATNHAEACAGTNPTDAKDHLSATLRTTADKKMLLSWPSVFGKRYRIETSTDLKTWANVRSQLTGTGDTLTEILGETASAASPSFWRVAVYDTDTDDDGLSDWEESQIGSAPDSEDADADGVRDLQEYLQGTDPNIADDPVERVAPPNRVQDQRRQRKPPRTRMESSSNSSIRIGSVL